MLDTVGKMKTKLEKETSSHADTKQQMLELNNKLQEIVAQVGIKHFTSQEHLRKEVNPSLHLTYEPRCEKTGLQGIRPGPTQTGL